jgi:hypothetical protein
MTSAPVLLSKEMWGLLCELLASVLRGCSLIMTSASILLSKERWGLLCEPLVCFVRVLTYYDLRAFPSV